MRKDQASKLTKKLERVRAVAAEPCAKCDQNPAFWNHDLMNQLMEFRAT